MVYIPVNITFCVCVCVSSVFVVLMVLVLFIVSTLLECVLIKGHNLNLVNNLFNLFLFYF